MHFFILKRIVNQIPNKNVIIQTIKFEFLKNTNLLSILNLLLSYLHFNFKSLNFNYLKISYNYISVNLKIIKIANAKNFSLKVFKSNLINKNVI